MPKIPSKYIRQLGLPYMGSKRGIAFAVVCAIYQRHPEAEYFYDLFGGGGAISAMALQFGYKVIYNEFNSSVYSLFTRCVKAEPLPREWYQWVSREQFFDSLTKTDLYSAMIQYCWSFGNRGGSYFCSKKDEHKMRLLHEVVVNKNTAALDMFNASWGTKMSMPQQKTIHQRSMQINKHTGIKLPPLGSLRRLERLGKIDKVGALCRLETHNRSYDEIKIDKPEEKVIVYLDPPYRGTEKYASGNFDHEKLDRYFAGLPYHTYMSEYNAPFKCVWKTPKRQLLNTACNCKFVIEKLFWNGK